LATTLIWPGKGVNEKLDYEIDWGPRLRDSNPPDNIAASAWTIPGGLTSSSPSFTSKKTKIWLESGVLGTTYSCVNRITTATGRILEQTVQLPIVAK
jgi:hypothetical protein